MPLVYQQNINPHTKLAVWHIAEPESFFVKSVSVQRNITHPHKRLQHLAGRYLLKELYPDFPYELIKIADTRKPFLENEAYHFSISHCGDYAAVMVSTLYRVGVDVERINSKVQKVQHKYLSAAEMQVLLPNTIASEALLNRQLTLAWSIKEALFKWYGDGEMDFIEHLHIDTLFNDADEGRAQCRISKNDGYHLTVHWLLFNNNCISWVVS